MPKAYSLDLRERAVSRFVTGERVRLVDAKQANNIVDVFGKIGLLLINVSLPNGINGRQLSDAVLQMRPGFPVIFITGCVEQAVLHDRDLRAGMRVRMKPFAAEKLAKLVQDALILG